MFFNRLSLIALFVSIMGNISQASGGPVGDLSAAIPSLGEAMTSCYNASKNLVFSTVVDPRAMPSLISQRAPYTPANTDVLKGLHRAGSGLLISGGNMYLVILPLLRYQRSYTFFSNGTYGIQPGNLYNDLSDIPSNAALTLSFLQVGQGFKEFVGGFGDLSVVAYEKGSQWISAVGSSSWFTGITRKIHWN